MRAREIKFRAVLENFQRTKKFVSESFSIDNQLWKIFKNESYLGVETVTTSKKFLNEIPEVEWKDGWSLVELIQNIGLEDKNGEDIYEDFICKKTGVGIVKDVDDIFVVKTINGNTYAVYSETDKELLSNLINYGNERVAVFVEIIGNKYESPELLEK